MAGAEELRAELEKERGHLLKQVEAMDPMARSGPDFDDNFADHGQVAAEQGENRVLYDQLKRELDDVVAALSRMDEGTYGTCVTCGEGIGDARLEAMPSTPYCITHA